MRTYRPRITVLLLAAFGLAFSPAAAQPRKKVKAATQGDIDRLEKKIEEQQRQIDKLIRVQQQFLGALSAQFEGAAPPPVPTEPKPVPVVPPKPTPTSEKVEPKPAAAKPAAAAAAKPDKKGEGGTVVGKVEGAGDAIVYVESIVAPVKASAAMKQEGKQFLPQTLVVTKGTTWSSRTATRSFTTCSR